MNEKITLLASGYTWSCPVCGKSNYIPKVLSQATCEHCGESTKVERVVHKMKVTPGQVVVEAAGYRFTCPECRETVYVGAASRDVRCRFCGAVMYAEWLQHRIDSIIQEPEKAPVQVTEQTDENPLPDTISKQVEEIEKGTGDSVEITENQLSLTL